MVLHQAEVDDAPIGRVHAHAALRFLHHDRRDEAVVDLRRFRDGLDRVVDFVDLLATVGRDAKGGAGARLDGFVGVKPSVVIGRQCQNQGQGGRRGLLPDGGGVPCVRRRCASLHVLVRDPQVLAWPIIRRGAIAAVKMYWSLPQPLPSSTALLP